MPAPFLHTCTITRAAPDARARDAFDVPAGPEPDPVEVYAGRCYVSEDLSLIRRLESGDQTATGNRQGINALVRLPGPLGGAINIESDTVEAVYNGVTRTGRIIDTNEAEFFRSLDELSPRRRRHTLTLRNTMAYARFLHEKEGFFVFSDKHLTQTADRHVIDLLASDAPFTDRTMALALEGAGFDEVDFLRSYTSEMRPPVRSGQGPRRAHPGHFGDVSTNLRNAYGFRVNEQGWQQ